METSTASYSPTERTQVRRRAQRGVYDKAQVHAILDEGFVCHVGFVLDGQPFVIPTAYARFGRTDLHSWIARQPADARPAKKSICA